MPLKQNVQVSDTTGDAIKTLNYYKKINNWRSF